MWKLFQIATLAKLDKFRSTFNTGRFILSENALKAEKSEGVQEEDLLRANLYEFLATLLRVEPSDEVVFQVTELSGDDTPIGQASSTLAHLAQKMDASSGVMNL